MACNRACRSNGCAHQATGFGSTSCGAFTLRSASVRALGRLGVKSAEEVMRTLLHDPVQEVRKAAQAALRNLNEKEPPAQRTTPIIAADGTRSWIVEKKQQAQQAADEDTGWKSRLRSIIDA